MDDLSPIEDVRLPDSFDVQHRMGDFWAGQPIILVWLRHYG
jgi:hypothetical protein